MEKLEFKARISKHMVMVAEDMNMSPVSFTVAAWPLPHLEGQRERLVFYKPTGQFLSPFPAFRKLVVIGKILSLEEIFLQSIQVQNVLSSSHLCRKGLVLIHLKMHSQCRAKLKGTILKNESFIFEN